MLTDMASKLFADLFDDEAMRRARAGVWPADAWRAIEQMGLPFALVPEAQGGFGIAVPDALGLVRLSGFHALPLPLAETMIANRLLAQAGLPLADGPATILPRADQRAPWARDAAVLVAETAEGGIARVTGWHQGTPGVNLAQMPRDGVQSGWQVAQAGQAAEPMRLLAAAVRGIQIAGALQKLLALTIAHVSERQQFGRPLSKFQAVQHELAKIASEAAAAGAAADMVAEAIAEERDLTLPVAAARVRTGEAVGTAVAIAHQLHGAIGFTREHRLHWYTTALWSWRDEYGGHNHWTQLLGQAALRAGPSGYWAFLTEAA